MVTDAGAPPVHSLSPPRPQHTQHKHRVAGFLALAWGNVLVGDWAAHDGGAGGSLFHVWWLLLLLASMASLALFSLLLIDPGWVVPTDHASATATAQVCTGRDSKDLTVVDLTVFKCIKRLPE